MNEEERGYWYLLTGLVIGILLGLLYAWVVQPVEYVDTSPALLRSDFKDHYRVMIAVAYAANGDLLRARARLELMDDEDMYRTLSEQAQRMLAEGGSADEARALGLLAIALGQASSGPAGTIAQDHEIPTAVTPYATHAISPSPSMTLTPTFTHTTSPEFSPDSTEGATPSAIVAKETFVDTPIPGLNGTPTQTRTSFSTPGGPFVLLSRGKDCNKELKAPLIKVEATDLLGQPVLGALVIVAWEGGEERFYTGLKPEKGLGYADFTPLPGVVYSLRLGESGEPVLDFSALECQRPGGGRFWGAWLLKFVQP